jgi:hypothetical protein
MEVITIMKVVDDDGLEVLEIRLGVDIYHENKEKEKSIFLEWEETPEDLRGKLELCCQHLQKCFELFEPLKAELIKIYLSHK